MSQKSVDNFAQQIPQHDSSEKPVDAGQIASRAFSDQAVGMNSWRVTEHKSDNTHDLFGLVELDSQIGPVQDFGTDLRQLERSEQTSERNKPENPRADVAAIRSRLREAGIDPDHLSFKIGIWEPADSNFSQEEGDQHAGLVKCTITDPELGLSRGAPVYLNRDSLQNAYLPNYAEQPDGLKHYISDHSTAIIDGFSDYLKRSVLTGNDASLRVISVSYGTTPVDAAMHTFRHFQNEPENYAVMIKQVLGDEKGNQFIEEQKSKLANSPPQEDSEKRDDWNTCPDVRDENLQPDESTIDPPTALETEVLQKLIDTYQSTLDNDPAFQKSMKRYRETAKEVANRGVMIVLAAANNGERPERYGVSYENRSGYNLYAHSEHVLAIGGYDAGRHDAMFVGSSPGTEQNPITVLGPGENVPTRLSPDGITGGTSFATPLTAATVALMLTQNPDLKFQDVRRMLQANADRISGVDPIWQGAGMLRMDDAVLAARDSRRRK